MTELFFKKLVVQSPVLRALVLLPLLLVVAPVSAQQTLAPLTRLSDEAIGAALAPISAVPALVNVGSGGLIDLGASPADDLLGLGNSNVIPLGEPPADAVVAANIDKGGDRSLGLKFCDDDDSDGICNSQDYCQHTPPQSVVLPSGCHLSRDAPLELVGVFFDFNGAVLRAESHEILDRVVAVLRQQSRVMVEIGGHTDSRGSVETNRKLSEKRAKAVYDYLVAQGVAAYRLRYKGYGESQPVAQNQIADGSDDAAGRARNRRVDLRVIGDVAALPAQQPMAP